VLGDFRNRQFFKVPQQHYLKIVRRQRFKRMRKVNSQSILSAASQLLLCHIILQWFMSEHQSFEFTALAFDDSKQPRGKAIAAFRLVTLREIINNDSCTASSTSLTWQCRRA
jgi:hypothetical protein